MVSRNSHLEKNEKHRDKNTISAIFNYESQEHSILTPLKKGKVYTDIKGRFVSLLLSSFIHKTIDFPDRGQNLYFKPFLLSFVYLKQYLIFCNPVKFLRLNAVFTGIRTMLTNYNLLDDNKDKYLQRRLMGLRVSWAILQFFLFPMVLHLMISISFNECRVKSFVKVDVWWIIRGLSMSNVP